MQKPGTVAWNAWLATSELSQKKNKANTREVARISVSKSPRVKATLNAAYAELLKHASELLERARLLESKAKRTAKRKGASLKIIGFSAELSHWIEMTAQVCDTAYRRTQLGEKVPNEEKLFSLFEPHTQLYRRGKAGQPNQFGRMILIYEDGAGFISHYHLMARDASDASVVCEQTKIAQVRHNHAIEEASFDRGFYSKENEEELKEIIDGLCLPPSHRNQYAERMDKAPIEFRNARQRHPGIESAIGNRLNPIQAAEKLLHACLKDTNEKAPPQRVTRPNSTESLP